MQRRDFRFRNKDRGANADNRVRSSEQGVMPSGNQRLRGDLVRGWKDALTCIVEGCEWDTSAFLCYSVGSGGPQWVEACAPSCALGK